MPGIQRVAIITHANDNFHNSTYLLRRLSLCWEGMGIEVQVHSDPGQAPLDVDLAFLHLDLTRVPEPYRTLISQYPRVINGRVLDISKSAFSRQILRRGEAYSGPVLVKTDNNFGGMPELQERYREGSAGSDLSIQRPWSRVEALTEYPTFDSAAAVPSGVWRNPHLVVEKLLPERDEDGLFILRVWIFCGDHGIYYKCISEEPIIKSHNTIRREGLEVSEIPPGLRQMREQLGFDYGKFDFGIVDGEVVLYDVNRTPGAPGDGKSSPEAEANIRFLAEGITTFTDR